MNDLCKKSFLQQAYHLHLGTLRELARVCSWLAFGYGKAVALIEGRPIRKDSPRVIVERHRNGLKEKISLRIDKRELHQFGAIDGLVIA